MIPQRVHYLSIRVVPLKCSLWRITLVLLGHGVEVWNLKEQEVEKEEEWKQKKNKERKLRIVSGQ